MKSGIYSLFSTCNYLLTLPYSYLRVLNFNSECSMCSCVRPLAEVIAVVGNKWCKAIVSYLVMAFKESSYDAFTPMSCQVYICIFPFIFFADAFLPKWLTRKPLFMSTSENIYISVYLTDQYNEIVFGQLSF